MVRSYSFSFPIALAGLLAAGLISSAPARAQTAAGADSQEAGEWLAWDAATRTVTFELVAGSPGAKSPFNFNGYVDGEANLVVPPGSNVVFNFVQSDGTPHSAVVIEDEQPLPNMDGDPAIPRAYTSKVLEGLPQEARDTVRFTAPDSGSFLIFCGVPGHGLSGMWIRFTVDPAAKEPRFETTAQSG